MTAAALARLAMAVSAVMLAHQVASKAVRDAVFLGAMPVTDLPRMVILAAVVTLCAVPLYSRLLAWRGPRAIVPIGFLISAATHVAEWRYYGSSELLPILVYLHIASVGPLLLSGFWSLTGELFDPHSARKHVVRIATAGSLGGIVGGLVVERVGAWASSEWALLLLATLHGAVAVGLLWLGRSGSESTRDWTADPLFSAHDWKASRQVREIAMLVLLGTASAAILDYLLKSRAAAEYSGGDLLRFFALFYTVTQVGTFVSQALFAAPAQRVLGVGRTVTTLPLGVGAGSLAALFFPTTGAFAIARLLEFVLRGSLFRSGYELLFSAMAPAERRRVKVFLDVACDRLGDALGAGLVQVLLLSGSVFLVSELLGAVLLMVAASIWLGGRLDAQYIRSIEQRLVDHGLADGLVTLAEFGAPTVMSIDVSAVSAAVEAIEPVGPPRETVIVQTRQDEALDLLDDLRSGDRDRVLRALDASAGFETIHVAQVVQLLAWDDVTTAARRVLERKADHHVGLLADALLDGGTDFAIRRRIPRVLIAAPTQRSLDGLVLGLADPRFEVRYQCSRAMDRILVAEPTLRIDEARILQVIDRELSVARPVWNGHRLLDQFESSDAVMYLDDQLRDRANRSLEHVFSLLVTILPREPVRVAFRAVHSEDQMLRGLAREYLSGVLPAGIRRKLWETLDSVDTRDSIALAPAARAAIAAMLRSQDAVPTVSPSDVTASDDDARGQSDPPPPASQS